ncbi:MAG TPA: hypothetical protein VGJ20_38165, partial [Xanthobacteraceae bacterium]
RGRDDLEYQANLDRLLSRQVAGIFMAEYGKARSVAIYSVPLPHGPRRHRLKASRPCVSQRQMRALDQVKNCAHPAYSRVRDLVWGIRCQEAIFVLSTL